MEVIWYLWRTDFYGSKTLVSSFRTKSAADSEMAYLQRVEPDYLYELEEDIEY